MKALRWLSAAALIGSIAYSGRELLAVSRLAKGLNPASPTQGLPPTAAKIAAAEMGGLDLASKIASLDGSGPESSSAPAAAPTPASAPRPEHAEAGDTNSAPGKIISARGGRDKAAIPGGAMIVDANGSRLEIVPSKRPKTATRTLPSLPKVELPSLDDPRASLAQRKLRAEAALVAGALAAFALAFWARRFR